MPRKLGWRRWRPREAGCGFDGLHDEVLQSFCRSPQKLDSVTKSTANFTNRHGMSVLARHGLVPTAVRSRARVLFGLQRWRTPLFSHRPRLAATAVSAPIAEIANGVCLPGCVSKGNRAVELLPTAGAVRELSSFKLVRRSPEGMVTGKDS